MDLNREVAIGGNTGIRGENPMVPETPARPGVRGCFIAAVAFSLLFVFLLKLPGAEASLHRRFLKFPREVRPLSGGLDKTPVFNSNSPESVTSDGVVLSTFPKGSLAANLGYAFDGRFDVFVHHITSKETGDRQDELFLGLLAGNSEDKPVKVEVLNAASYLSRPDAPFIPLPPLIENDDGRKFAGPGDRVTTDLLRDVQGVDWKKKVEILPNKQILLQKLVIPVSGLKPQLNGRTYMARLKSDGPVRLALVTHYSHPRRRLVRKVLRVLPPIHINKYKAPKEQEFIELLGTGELVRPRERHPTPLDDKGPIRYGRVSGVSIGSVWQATLTDDGLPYLALPHPEKPISFVLSSFKDDSFGTGQVQSAPLAVRNPDTAYEANGNYGVKYELTLPLKNMTKRDLKVSLSMETPVKSESESGTLTFLDPPSQQVYFRGTIRLNVRTKDGTDNVSYFHIVQHRGERGQPFLTLPMSAGQEQFVTVQFYYPPDCTPPQLLTLSSSPAEGSGRDIAQR